jgi:two-component SAPR family response regulator
MPQKDGKKVYDKIRKIKPDIKVLFMSGYTADIIHKNDIVDDNLNFLAKPVTPDKLLNKIHEITGKI